jgi:8-oxo-dGTP diphosphatase
MLEILQHSVAKPYDLTVRAIIPSKDGQLLLLRRSSQSIHFAGEWEFPGGKVNPGERVGEALRREVLEETGLEVEPNGVAGVTEFELPGVRVVTLCFYAGQTGGNIRLSTEHEDFVWADSANLEALTLTQATRDALAERAHHPAPSCSQAKP